MNSDSKLTLSSHFGIIYNDFIETCNTFSYDSRQSRLALKTAIACVIAIFLTYSLRIPHAFWAGISTIIMMQPHAQASLHKGWMRAGGACIGSFLSLFLTAFTIQSPLLFSLFLFLIATTGFYLANRSRIGYFWSYMLGHIALMSMISVMNPYDTYPVHIAFYRASAVSIGVFVSIVINVLLWPEKEIDRDEQDNKHIQSSKQSKIKQSIHYINIRVFKSNISIHKETLIFSIKGGLGLLMVFWLWLWFEIPGGGLNMSVSVITIFQQDLITTFHKGLLRFSGCILGGTLGLFCISFAIESPLLIGLIIFAVIFPLAYIWGAKPGIAYLGAQGAIAFIIAVVPDSGPANELAPVIERVTGITMAITCIWILNLNIFRKKSVF